MKALTSIFAILVVVACGGETSPVDAGVDAPKVPCFGEARTTAQRMCNVAADCAVVDHEADCCGSIVEEGVRVDQVDAVHNAESEANAGCAVCNCVAKMTVDESGSNGGAYVASCDLNLCTAHAQ